ncbi:MAG: dihydrodipicolinate synthase family protein [Myxococcota bacterium]
MTEGAPIQGVFAAIPTPFDERRGVDVKALEYLADYLFERGIAGLGLFTEAAEDAFLTPDERRLIVKTVAGRLKGRKKFLLFVSTPSSLEAIELVKLAEPKGCAGVVLGPPRLPGLGYRELYRHLDRVAKATALPVLFLDRPDSVLDALMPEELAAFLGHPALKGVVAPSAGPAEVEAWGKRLKVKPPTILTGCTVGLAVRAKAGATGAVCAVAVVASEAAAAIAKAVAADDKHKAEKLEAELLPVIDVLGPPAIGEPKDGVQKLAARIAKRSLLGRTVPVSYSPALIKETLRLQGLPIRADLRPPLEAPRPEVIERLRLLLRESGVLE